MRTLSLRRHILGGLSLCMAGLFVACSAPIPLDPSSGNTRTGTNHNLAKAPVNGQTRPGISGLFNGIYTYNGSCEIYYESGALKVKNEVGWVVPAEEISPLEIKVDAWGVEGHLVNDFATVEWRVSNQPGVTCTWQRATPTLGERGPASTEFIHSYAYNGQCRFTNVYVPFTAINEVGLEALATGYSENCVWVPGWNLIAVLRPDFTQIDWITLDGEDVETPWVRAYF